MLTTIKNLFLATDVAAATLEVSEYLGLQFPIGGAAPITMHGRPGFLAWDCSAYNETTFYNDDQEVKQSLFTGLSDEKARQEFDELVKSHTQE
jgi:hypothetical protein